MTTPYQIRYLKPAQRDLIGIFDYIALDSPAAAEKFVIRIDTKIKRLERFPRSGTQPKDTRLKNQGYRFLIVDDYLIFYKVIGKSVFIWRVLHGRRRYEFLM